MTQSTVQNDSISLFITELLEKADLSNIPEDFKKEYSDKLSVEAQRRLGMMAARELDEKSIEKFGKLVEADANSDVLYAFFKANISDFENKMQQVLAGFADEFLKGVQNLKST